MGKPIPRSLVIGFNETIMARNTHFLRSTYSDSLIQMKKLGRILLIYNGILIIVFASIWIIGSRFLIDFGLITRDPNQLAGFHPFIGILSQIGIIMWSSTASLCFLAYVFAKNSADKNFRRFLFFSAFLTAWLLLDDIFIIHEILGPEYFHIKQNYFYGIYFFVTLVYLLSFLRVILRTEFVLLIIAFIYFGLSIILDYVSSKMDYEINTLIEDAFKFFGIMMWFLYFLRLCIKVARGQSIRE